MPNSAAHDAGQASAGSRASSLDAPGQAAPCGLSLPPLELPGEGGEEVAWERDFDTPRDAPSSPASSSAPASPSAARKSKPRAARHWGRTNSLKDAKVLIVTGMRRSESVLHPDLFRYHDHFEFLGLVGRTHLSEVFRVRHRHTGELFAVKRSRRRFRSKLQRERCLREIRAVAALPQHPNIVGQYRAWQEGGHFYIQMDLCQGGNLQHAARRAQTDGHGLPDAQLWRVAYEVAQGLSFLHSHGVLHLDIKPENIYLDQGGTCCIGDFGLAVANEGGKDWEEGDGDYVAPELLSVGGEPSAAADVFSLGATLFECASGRKLARAAESAEVDLAALALPQRDPALQQLLRSMLQAEPGARPSAQQVVEFVRQQGQAPLAAAVAAAQAATPGMRQLQAASGGAAAAEGSPSQAVQLGGVPSPFAASAARCSGAPGSTASPGAQPYRSPFQALIEQQHQQQASPARAVVGAEAPSPQRAFSFDVPHQLPTYGTTPSAPRSRQQRVAGGQGSAVKVTPTAPRLAGRWQPALSPLISEGALTPGAAAALVGLTPQQQQGPSSSGSGSRDGTPPLARALSTPLDAHRPAPLQLPAGAASGGTLPSSSGGGGPPSLQLVSGGTQDSREGWHLWRRDVLSPDSDLMNASVSESEAYTYSCGTGDSVSDLDFMDTLSAPVSPEFAMGGSAAPTPTSAATPEVFLRGGSATPTPRSARQLARRSASPAHAASVERGASAPPAVAGARAAGPSRLGLQPAASLTWDLHTSPEFLMQLPPGSPYSLSRSSSFGEGGQQTARAFSSIRRFPTLDSWGSKDGLCGGGGSGPQAPLQQQQQQAAGDAAASSAPGAVPQRLDSLAGLAAQRLTLECGHTPHQQELQQAAGEQEGAAAAAAAALVVEVVQEAEAAAAAAVQPAAGGRSGLLRKRHHSSRRTLLQVLSRDGSFASMDCLQPDTSKMRHSRDSMDGLAEEEQQQVLAAEGGPRPSGDSATCGDALPPMGGGKPHMGPAALGGRQPPSLHLNSRLTSMRLCDGSDRE